MDKLSDLPAVDTKKTQQEKDIMNTFFPEEKVSLTDRIKSNWKIIAISSTLFIILANPWVDSMLCNLPKCDNPTILFIAKTIIFVLAILAISLMV